MGQNHQGTNGSHIPQTIFSFSLLFSKFYVQKGVLLHVVQNFMKLLSPSILL